MWELRQVLEAMGQKPTEEELFQMISEVDNDLSNSIDFGEFLQVIESQKKRARVRLEKKDTEIAILRQQNTELDARRQEQLAEMEGIARGRRVS